MNKFLLALAVPLLFSACKPEGNRQVNTVEAIVSQVVLPDTIELGDTATIAMAYKILNDCGVYAGTDISRNANTILIRPMVTYTFEEDKPCPENITFREETFRFKPEAKGKYLFYFRKENPNNYEADSLVVK